MATVADLLKNQGSISTYHPTLADKLQDYIASGLKRVGFGDRSADRFAGKLSNAVDALTPFGAATEAQQAMRSAKSGHYVAAAGHSLGAILSAIPDGGSAAAHGGAALLHSIIAPLYHGSPHKFEKFALDKIGTGEGAQAYGHGLYFAENPAVARSYMGSAQVPEATIAHAALQQAGGDRDRAIAMLEASVRPGVKLEHSPALRAAQRLREGLSGQHLYEVKLDANPEDFLNWDAPLSQQGEPVKNAMSGLGINPNAWRGSDSGMPGDLAYHTVVERSMRPNTIGLVAEHHGRMAATQRLNEAGVRGIRYLDQGSRGAGQGTSNYVVFDPSIIDILNRQ